MAETLTVVGLVVTVVVGLETIDGVIGPIQWSRETMAARRWKKNGFGLEDVAKIVSGEDLPAGSPLVFSQWNHNLEIGPEGGTVHEIQALAVNASDRACGKVDFPLYGEPGYLPSDFWVSIGRNRRDLNPREWDSERGIGYLRVSFDVPIEPGESLRMRWGYSSKVGYSEGDEWFEWHVQQPVRDYRLKVITDKGWDIPHARTTIVGGDRDAPEPVSKGHTIRWHVLEPPVGRKLRLDFILRRSANAD